MLTAQIELAKLTPPYAGKETPTAVYIYMHVSNSETSETQEFRFRYDTIDLYSISDFANILPLKEGVNNDSTEVTIDLVKISSVTDRHLRIAHRLTSPDPYIVFGDAMADSYIVLNNEQAQFLTQAQYKHNTTYRVKMTPKSVEQDITLELTKKARRISLLIRFDSIPPMSRELGYKTESDYNESMFARLLSLSGNSKYKKARAVMQITPFASTTPTSDRHQARYLLPYNSYHNDWGLDDPKAQNVAHFSSDLAKATLFGTETPTKTNYIMSIRLKDEVPSCTPNNTHPSDQENEVTPTPVTNCKENPPMTKTPPPLFETMFLCRGENIDNLSNEQIYEAIAKEEQKITELQNINNKPDSLKREITARKTQIQNLVDYLNNEENTPD